jgi:hypothetical protein
MALTRASNTVVGLLLSIAAATAQPTLPGTQPLTLQGDLAAQMVDQINAYLERELAVSVEKRARVQPDRERFRRIIGAIDTRRPIQALELDANTTASGPIAETSGYKVWAVRWPVLEGVYGEGLLLEPKAAPIARVVAIPDADWSPEMLAGLAPGVDSVAQFARRLAENGCEVVIPVLIDRKDTWSGIPGIRMTNQPHREFLYRMAFEVGRHIIGYELQKILSLIDWFAHENGSGRVKSSDRRGWLWRRWLARPVQRRARSADRGHSRERLLPAA